MCCLRFKDQHILYRAFRLQTWTLLTMARRTKYLCIDWYLAHLLQWLRRRQLLALRSNGCPFRVKSTVLEYWPDLVSACCFPMDHYMVSTTVNQQEYPKLNRCTPLWIDEGMKIWKALFQSKVFELRWKKSRVDDFKLLDWLQIGGSCPNGRPFDERYPKDWATHWTALIDDLRLLSIAWWREQKSTRTDRDKYTNTDFLPRAQLSRLACGRMLWMWRKYWKTRLANTLFLGNNLRGTEIILQLFHYVCVREALRLLCT